MTVSLSTRFGLTRWSSDEDPWSREELDANFGAIETLGAQAVQGLNSDRPTDHVARRFYLATDAERVYLDDGDEWHEFLVLATGGTVTGVTDFTAGLKLNGQTVAIAADLNSHLNDSSDAHDASAVSFVATGGIAATDVQAALVELDTEKATAAALTAHTGAAAGAHAATAISNTPAGNVAATTVQAAIDELDTEKLAKAGGTVTGLVTFSSSPTLADGVDLTIGTGTGSKIGQASSKLGFFGATPVGRQGTYNLTGSADRTLGAYASDPESSVYTGTPADAASTAKLADLNALRVAYENLRAYVEDLAGVVIATATDAKTLGLLG